MMHLEIWIDPGSFFLGSLFGCLAFLGLIVVISLSLQRRKKHDLP